MNVFFRNVSRQSHYEEGVFFLIYCDTGKYNLKDGPPNRISQQYVSVCMVQKEGQPTTTDSHRTACWGKTNKWDHPACSSLFNLLKELIIIMMAKSRWIRFAKTKLSKKNSNDDNSLGSDCAEQSAMWNQMSRSKIWRATCHDLGYETRRHAEELKKTDFIKNRPFLHAGKLYQKRRCLCKEVFVLSNTRSAPTFRRRTLHL